MASESYSPLARWLHWAVAGLIVVQYVLAQLAERADDAGQMLRQLGLLANHKSVGLTILALAVLRLLYRLVRRPPALPASMPRWQVTASHVSHWSLYVLLLAMPLSGWMMSSASAYSVSWFGLFQVPDLVAADPGLKDTLHEVHEWLGYALLALAAVHILAALKHAFVDRDGVLSRMSSLSALLLFAAIIVAGLAWLASPGRAAAPAKQTEAQTPGTPATGLPDPADAASDESAEVTAPADPHPAIPEPAIDPVTLTVALPEDNEAEEASAEPSAPAASQARAEPVPWDIDYDASFIRFTGEQAGAVFEGRWTDWTARIRFSGQNLAGSALDVTINTAGVDTKDAERDDVMGDPDWFDVERHPQAFYRANQFEDKGNNRYLALGELTIKGKASPVVLDLTVTSDGDRQVIEGSSRSRLLVGKSLLDRLALGVGTGEWEDTEWVGQEVRVDVRVEATVPPESRP